MDSPVSRLDDILKTSEVRTLLCGSLPLAVVNPLWTVEPIVEIEIIIGVYVDFIYKK